MMSVIKYHCITQIPFRWNDFFRKILDDKDGCQMMRKKTTHSVFWINKVFFPFIWSGIDLIVDLNTAHVHDFLKQETKSIKYLFAFCKVFTSFLKYNNLQGFEIFTYRALFLLKRLIILKKNIAMCLVWYSQSVWAIFIQIKTK